MDGVSLMRSVTVPSKKGHPPHGPSLPDTFWGAEKRKSVSEKQKLSHQRENKTTPWGTISMDASAHIWRDWLAQIKSFFPRIHGHHNKPLAHFVCGLILAGSAVVHRIAEKLSSVSTAKIPSIERRLARFLANDRMIVTTIWK